jgi:putative ABC transport system permease protein
MHIFAVWRARLRALRTRPDLDRELNQELADWIDELSRRYEAAGATPAAARRRAMLETGGLEQVKDQVRDVRPGWFRGLFGTSSDRVRFDLATAFRSLRATPGPTTAAIATLALAAGVNLAMFNLLDRALLSPPAHLVKPSQLFTAVFHAGDAPDEGIRTSTSYVTYRDLRDRVPSLAGAAAFQNAAATVMIDGDQRKVSALFVSGNYFALLGASPRIGSGITPANDESGAAAAVAVLSDQFWRSAFGSDPNVIGRRLSLRGHDYQVSGVMPAGFSGHSPSATDVWIPLAAAMQDTPDWDRSPYRNVASVLVRVGDGQSMDAVESQARIATGSRTTFEPLGGADVGAAERRISWWLAGVAVLVLFIGLANAGTLLLVRATKRRKDIAIRTALGASQRRLLVQSSVEAAMLAAIATGAAIVMTSWLDEAIRKVLFPSLAVAESIGRSTLSVGAFTAALTFVVATLANLAQFRAEIRSARVGRAKTLTGMLLVQTAFSVLLLSGAAMFGRSLYNLMTQDLGLNMTNVVLAEFEPGPDAGRADGQLFSDAIEKLRTMPGVEMVSPIASVPFGSFNVPPIAVPGHAEPPSVGGQLPNLIASTPELFKILGIRVIEGRPFSDDDARGAPVVIVNQTMALATWPGDSAIGKCIRIGFDPDFDPETATGPPTPSAAVPCRAVIGVTADVRQRSLVPTGNEAKLMQYYVPITQVPQPPFAPVQSPVWGLMLRLHGHDDGTVSSIRRAIVGTRTHLPFLRVIPYAQLLDRQKRPWELGTILLAIFSAVALAVAAVGLYAAFAHAVGERRHEMAIRLAIGARPSGVRRMILGEALMLAGAGVAIGCVLAMLSGRWIGAMLFHTAPSDPLVLGFAALLMLLVAAAATLMPALAASNADPSVLLRVE